MQNLSILRFFVLFEYAFFVQDICPDPKIAVPLQRISK